MAVTPFLKRRQQVLKPRYSPDIFLNAEVFAVEEAGAASANPSMGEGTSVRPGSWTEAKAQDGSPGNLGDPAHVHVRASRQSGRRLNNDPGPEGTLRPSGSASASCETRTEEGSVDPGSETNK
jgi:hypothetical protein